MVDNYSFFISRSCPICSSGRCRKVFEVAADPFFAKRLGLTTASVVQCETCRTRYTNPVLRPEFDALQYLESEGYNQPVISSPELLCWEDQIICCREIVSHAPGKNTKLLDVGCGEGGLVYLCQKIDLDAHGIELNKNAVYRATQTGIRNITCDKLEDVESSSFDIITAIHVLEHLHDCREFAAQSARVLKTQGLVVIAVPNYFAFQSRFKQKSYWNAPFQHMNGLTSWSLDHLFRDFGFQRIPVQSSFAKKAEGISFKSRLSMVLTKVLGNSFNLFPTKLICMYHKIFL